MAGLGATLIVARLAARSFGARVVSGTEGMIEAEATIVDWHEGRGHVWAEGERWETAGPAGQTAKTPVHITAIRGLVLQIAPRGADSETQPPGAGG